MNATRPNTIRCAAHLSTAADAAIAIAECVDAIRLQLSGPASVVFLFASPHFGEQLGQAAAELARQLETVHVLGCTGESIVGGGREVESERAIAGFRLLAVGGSQVFGDVFASTIKPSGDDTEAIDAFGRFMTLIIRGLMAE